jgi:hypothetical protein
MLTTTTYGDPRRGHLSRRERQQPARTAAFSRHAPVRAAATKVAFEPEELALIERLVRRDRTVISSALLIVAGEGDSLSAVSSDVSGPVVAEVLLFEDLPLGSLASRRAVVRWSDGSKGEGLRWYSDEILICEGDHGNSRLMSSRVEKSRR